MKISIEEQCPDGININVENLVLDTIDEANEFISWITKIWGHKKVAIEECKRILHKLEKVR